jgi:hypothetical protein
MASQVLFLTLTDFTVSVAANPGLLTFLTRIQQQGYEMRANLNWAQQVLALVLHVPLNRTLGPETV